MRVEDINSLSCRSFDVYWPPTGGRIFNVSVSFRLICPKFIFDQLLIGRSNRFRSSQSTCSKVFSKYGRISGRMDISR